MKGFSMKHGGYDTFTNYITAKLAYDLEQKSLSSHRNLALVTYSKLLILVLKKLYYIYSTARKCCLLHLIKHTF